MADFMHELLIMLKKNMEHIFYVLIKKYSEKREIYFYRNFNVI